MSVIEPRCYSRSCKHFVGAQAVSGVKKTDHCILKCKAFPEGIPESIAYGDNKHTQPVEGDNGIQYERSPE